MENQFSEGRTCLQAFSGKNTVSDDRAILFNNLTGILVARKIRVYLEELKAEGN